MSFDLDSDDKPKPESKPKKDKEGDILSGMAKNQDLIIIVVLLAGVFLFKDEIMGLIDDLSGSLTPTMTNQETPPTTTEITNDQEIGDDDIDTDRRGRRVGVRERIEMHKKARAGKRRSRVAMANVNSW